MVKSKYNVIGVMSGTSLDGIDLIYATYFFDKKWHFEISLAETLSYSKTWKNTLKGLIYNSLKELKKIDEDYTQYLAIIINSFINKNNIKEIDAICSHGHTALHQPDKNRTYQIGNLPNISKLTNNKVVCDFRVQDVKYGGQGAPLVPIGDEHLFSDYDFCVNLGGFANISTKVNNKRIAYDICPVNIVLNHYVSVLGFDYDKGGDIAATGEVNYKLLQALNDIEFYAESHPKSLGLEWVNENIFPCIDSFKLEVKNILRTFVEHIAMQIAFNINNNPEKRALFTGGGVYNSFLIDRVNHHSATKVIIPSNKIIEFKEALIFGFLGILKLRGEVNCLESVTGAMKSHSSGEVYNP